MHWVVTGANRGIGLAITRKLLDRGEYVTVGVRTSMPIEHPRLRVLNVEMSNPVSVEEFAKRIEGPVDVVINNAGVLIEEKFPNVTEEGMLLSFRVNTMGPYFLVQALYNGGKLAPGSKVINITSVLGSIAATSSTASYPYSVSKAALNMVTKLLASKLRDMYVVSVHPGWVRTDMGGPNAPVMPDESADGILRLVEHLNESGVFLDYTGRRMEW